LNLKKLSFNIILCSVLAVQLYSCGDNKNISGDLKLKPLTYSSFDSIVKANRKTVLYINLWASWCKPCVEELPDFAKFYNLSKKEASGYEVLFISLDQPKKIQKTAYPLLLQLGINGRHYFINSRLTKFVNHFDDKWDGALPATIIVMGGKIKAIYQKSLNFADLEEILINCQN